MATETWYFNETVDVSQDRTFNVNYHVDGIPFDLMFISVDTRGTNKEINYGFYPNPGKPQRVNITVYYNGSWGGEEPRTIILDEPATGDLLTWLEANAIKQMGGSMLNVTYNSTKIIDSLEVTLPVEVTYNGNTIATLNEGDTKTLQCNGKLMASDVMIGEKTLQCSGKKMASDVVVEVGGGSNN